MYAEWPEYILDLPGFQEEFDPESGQLLFRGPRLRMGVSDGAPSSVLPDHMGRANYTGKQMQPMGDLHIRGVPGSGWSRHAAHQTVGCFQ